MLLGLYKKVVGCMSDPPNTGVESFFGESEQHIQAIRSNLFCITLKLSKKKHNMKH